MSKQLYKILQNIKGLSKNDALKICSNCVHFIEHTNNYPYDEQNYLNNEENAQCKKFGAVNLVTGIVEYDLAKNCRKNNNKCGTIGLHYTEKHV